MTPLAMAHPRVCGERVPSPWHRSKVLRAIPAAAGTPSYLTARPSFEISDNQTQDSIKPSHLRCSEHPTLLIQHEGAVLAQARQ